MRRRTAAMLAPATLALLLAGCSSGEEGMGAGAEEPTESTAPFTDCPVDVEEVGAGDLGSEVLITAGVYYSPDESIRAYDYNEAQDVANPVDMIEPEQRFCAERLDEKVSTWSDDISIELTPVQLENGETLYIEGEIGAPVPGEERASILGDSWLTVDEEFITDDLRKKAEDLKSGKASDE